MIESFRDRLLKEKSRPLTRAIVTSLKGLLKDAQRRGRVGQNVAADTEVKLAKRGKKKVEIPSKPELKAMVERSSELWPLTRIQTARGGEQRIVPVPWRPLLVTALFSGLRCSELRGLTWRHVNLKEGIIEVRQRADFRNEIGNPKSEAGNRDVPIPPAATKLLREWKMACPKTADGLAFPTANGTIIYNSNIHQQCWRPLLRDIGLIDTGKNEDGEEIEIPRYAFHHLRHAAASLFIEQGFSPKKLQAIMGHSSIQVTYDIYGHLWKDAESDAKAVAQIEANLLG
jgi:integrase